MEMKELITLLVDKEIIKIEVDNSLQITSVNFDLDGAYASHEITCELIKLFDAQFIMRQFPVLIINDFSLASILAYQNGTSFVKVTVNEKTDVVVNFDELDISPEHMSFMINELDGVSKCITMFAVDIKISLLEKYRVLIHELRAKGYQVQFLTLFNYECPSIMPIEEVYPISIISLKEIVDIIAEKKISSIGAFK